MSINKVCISGYLTRDPELRATASGTQFLKFGIAVNDRVRNSQTGEWEDKPNFIDCICFGSRAEGLFKVLSKGSKLFVEGRLSQNSWQPTDGGARRSSVSVVVESVDFGGPRTARTASTAVSGASYVPYTPPQPQVTPQPPSAPSQPVYAAPPSTPTQDGQEPYDPRIPF